MTPPLPGILFVHRNAHPRYFGGIERKIISIVAALADRGRFRCHLLTNHGDSPLATGASGAGATVHVQTMDGAAGLAATVRRIAALARSERIDILQSHMFWGSVAAGTVCRFRPGLRHLFRIHTHIEGSTISTAKQRAYHLADYLNEPGVDHYCVLSSALERELTRSSRIPAGKISVLLNGIPVPGPPHAIQDDQQPLPARIAVLGDLQPRKRQDLVIEALGLLNERGVRVECRFIGLERGDYGDQLRRLAGRLGVTDQLEFAGFQDPVLPWLEGIEVMVLDSDFEGVPTCMMEGMALNMLAVSSDVGGTSDLIEPGKNGFLLRPGDAGDLADRLQMIVTAPSSQLAPLRRAGHETFRRRCSLDAMIDGLLACYERLGIGATREVRA